MFFYLLIIRKQLHVSSHRYPLSIQFFTGIVNENLKKEEGKNRNISKLLNTHAICYLDIQSFKVLCICRKSFLYVSSKNIYPIQ